MTFVRNNISASTAGRFLAGAENKQQKTLQKLASGYAVNTAADNAAGLSISEKMRFYITGLNIGTRNVNDGSSLCQTADGALEEVQSMLNRMYGLTEQAANGIYDEQDREEINKEIASLKQEIGRIGGTTNFNGVRIFPPYYEFRVDGTMEDLEIFNATYDPSNKLATYGGIVFKGERFEWPAISPNMIDAAGMFVAGTYDLQTSSGKLTLICENGTKPPQIMRQFNVAADVNGIIIDGETIPWNRLQNEEGHAFNTSNIQPGSYSFPYYGSTISVDMFGDAETLDEVISEINRHAEFNMVWTSSQAGGRYSEAVDIVKVGQNGSIQVQMTNSMASQVLNNDIPLKIRADGVGIWVEDKDGTAVGTKMTWEDLGINSWSGGSDISENKTYHYKDTASGYQVEFSFTLLNETSKDSVIQGLNGVDLKYSQVGNDNKTELQVSNPPGQILSGTMKSYDSLSLSELIALGRDFGLQTENLGNATIQYDKDIPEWSLIFKDKNNIDLFVYKSNSQAQENIVSNYVTNYARRIEELVKKATLTGTSLMVDLSELLGAGNITSTGHLSEVVTATGDMIFTSGSGSYPPPVVGRQYPAAFIDFQGLGTSYTLDALSGLGFDSTCKTCSNHYSVVFVDNLAGGTVGTTANGYEYSVERTGDDYLMKVDISSLKSSGRISNGTDFSKALVEIIDAGGLDEHYTQYAAKGSKLYILDDRTSNTPATSASFYTEPFNMPPGECKVNINLMTPPPASKEIDLSYEYSIKDIKNRISATLNPDSNGAYIYDNTSRTYIAYDAANPTHAGVQRFRMDVNSLNVADYVKGVMQDIADKSDISLKATDFVNISTSGFDELFNEAIESIFNTTIEQNRPSLWIQASGEKDDGMWIELPALNLTVLGISLVNALTKESASDSMDKIYKAINKVSFIRGDFGASYNRLEVMQQNNTNYSERLQDAESRIRDLDVSKEVLKHVKTGILIEASQAMLAQANMLPQSVLSLLK